MMLPGYQRMPALFDPDPPIRQVPGMVPSIPLAQGMAMPQQGQPMMPSPVRPRARRRGALDALASIFGAGHDPNLSDEQNRALRNQALTQAGLATIMASSSGQARGLGAVAAGAMQGQQAGAQAREGFAQEASQEALDAQLGDVSGGFSLEQLTHLYNDARRRGDVTGQQTVASMLRDHPDYNSGDVSNLIGKDGRIYSVDDRGRLVATHGEAAPPELERVDLGDRIVWLNPDRTVAHTEVKGRAPSAGRSGGGGSRSGGRAPAGAVNPRVRAALTGLDSYEGLVREFMALPGTARLAAINGAGHQQLVGRIQAAQRAILLDMKELANLGALTGPDMDLITGMIGDPLTAAAAARDPEYILGRLEEARNYVRRQVRDAGPEAPAGPTTTAAEDAANARGASILSQFGAPQVGPVRPTRRRSPILTGIADLFGGGN